MLTRYPPTLRPKLTWYLLTAARESLLVLALSATLSVLHCGACAPTVDVEVDPSHTVGWGLVASALLWKFLRTERVHGLSDLNILLDQYCFDSHGSGVISPYAQAGLCGDASLPRSRHSLEFRRKGGNMALCSHQACCTEFSATSGLSRFAKKWGTLALCSDSKVKASLLVL